jgi:REP element-mobilizing transposase RayT
MPLRFQKEGFSGPCARGRRKVAHRRLAKLASRFPVHVTTRVCDDVRRLRGFEICAVLQRAFARGCDTGRFRICQFSVKGNYIHLVCEAVDAAALSRGTQRWSSMVGRGLNKKLGRTGAAVSWQGLVRWLT